MQEDCQYRARGPFGPKTSVRIALNLYGSFRKLGGTLFGVLIIRILLLRVLYWGPLFSETPILHKSIAKNERRYLQSSNPKLQTPNANLTSKDANIEAPKP